MGPNFVLLFNAQELFNILQKCCSGDELDAAVQARHVAPRKKLQNQLVKQIVLLLGQGQTFSWMHRSSSSRCVCSRNRSLRTIALSFFEQSQTHSLLSVSRGKSTNVCSMKQRWRCWCLLDHLFKGVDGDDDDGSGQVTGDSGRCCLHRLRAASNFYITVRQECAFPDVSSSLENRICGVEVLL